MTDFLCVHLKTISEMFEEIFFCQSTPDRPFTKCNLWMAPYQQQQLFISLKCYEFIGLNVLIYEDCFPVFFYKVSISIIFLSERIINHLLYMYRCVRRSIRSRYSDVSFLKPQSTSNKFLFCFNNFFEN